MRNRTTMQWTDWHVDLTNGAYIPGSAIVYNKSVPSIPWVIEVTGTGFFAHVQSGKDTQVDRNEVLYVFFSYDVVDPLQEVSIKQYPTDYYPIPEPATILGLLTGCLAFGFRVKRKA